jgi:hypothetical protein
MTVEPLVHPRAQSFRNALRNDSAGLLTQTLGAQAARSRPDFEVLYGAGQIARQDGIAGVESVVADWLRMSVSPRRWDVGACFLMGYWVTPVQPNESLVALLVRQLGQLDGRDPGWNEMLRALSAAVALTADSAAADRLRAALRSAVARAGAGSIQAGTAAALDAILGS